MKIFIILVLLFTVGLCQQRSFRLCVYPSDALLYCNDLNKGNEVQCVKVKDSVDCALKLMSNQVDFGLFQPEQILLESGFINNDAVAVAEVRSQIQEISKHNFQMVVVVKKDHTNGLKGLKGKKYCHPGFSNHDIWTPRTLQEFENVIFNYQTEDCDHKSTVSNVERNLDTLNQFFGESCRNGPWTKDRALNKRLHTTYPKLTALCDDNTRTDSLKCLKLKNADIAYTTLNEALKLQEKNEYRLLCKNGSLAFINRFIPNDCSWRNQPWSSVIARREIADDIRINLQRWIKPQYQAVTVGGEPLIPRQVGFPWYEIIARIFLQDLQQYRINIFTESYKLIEFFKSNNQSLDPNINADCPMRWCTISEQEQSKCNHLARASLYAGIEPQISCIQGNHIYDCLKKIKNNNADIIAIDSNFGYLARKMGLQNLLYSENSKDDISSIVAVIPEISSIKSFNDLKNKKACFPEYRSLAWVSFIDAARMHKVMPDNCEFGKSVSDFFEGVCAPGAKDDYHYRENNKIYDKLCSLCSDNCNSDISNSYFNNSGALACLFDNKADVAFVEWQEIESEPNLNNYKILCDNNEILAPSTFSENEAICALSNTVDSEVIVRQTDSRKHNYKHALLYMDYLFSSAFRNGKTFSMFEEFNGEKNLLFKENVLGLADDRSDNSYVQNYMKLFESVDKCNISSDSVFVTGSLINLFISCLFVMLLRQM